MAPDQGALLEVLDAPKAADVDDRIRSAATTIYQALIEAELTAGFATSPLLGRRGRGAHRGEAAGGKLLQDAEVSMVASDSSAPPASDMMAALVGGQRDPKVLAALARGRLGGKLTALAARAG